MLLYLLIVDLPWEISYSHVAVGKSLEEGIMIVDDAPAASINQTCWVASSTKKLINCAMGMESKIGKECGHPFP